MIAFISFAILSIILMAVTLCYEYHRDIMMLQQNSYRPERYMRWLRESGDTTTARRLVAVFLILLGLCRFGSAMFATICFSCFAIYCSAYLGSRKYKKPLAFTHRVKRIMIVLGILSLAVVAVALVLSLNGCFGEPAPLYAASVTLVILYAISHGMLLCTVWCLKPVEKSINRKFIQRATDRLASMKDLRIIGITGSYGKTSTKHYLYRILSEHFETLMTPGSFNTTLGVVRTINEKLRPYHEVFIVEMGAKQKGDIAEICDIVHPEAGIITSVGPQHLETFGSIEKVCETKFELADSLPREGTVILNNDCPLIAGREIDNCNTIRYSCSATNDAACSYVARDIRFSPRGTDFTLDCADGTSLELSTMLLGKHNIENLVAAIAAARLMGVPDSKIRYAVAHIEPVEHRLSKSRLGDGVLLIDDAFNSNPSGALMAVEVLASFKDCKRFILTPGMIELGDEQDQRNEIFGRQIAEHAIDCAVVIGHYNRDSIVRGLKAGGLDEGSIKCFDTFNEAFKWVMTQAKNGDVVLLENDLPDTFR